MPRWPSPDERFINALVEGENGCLEFIGGKAGDGYGVLRWDGRQQYAHRVAWIRKHGAIPNGLCVLHKCDNLSCANIDHLFLGTHEDNAQDMVAKGRHNPGKKLTKEQVIEIKNLFLTGLSHSNIAKKFNVSRHAITNINLGKNWLHVEIGEAQ